MVDAWGSGTLGKRKSGTSTKSQKARPTMVEVGYDVFVSPSDIVGLESVSKGSIHCPFRVTRIVLRGGGYVESKLSVSEVTQILKQVVK